MCHEGPHLQVGADNQHAVGFYRRLGYQDDRLTRLARWLRPLPGTE